MIAGLAVLRLRKRQDIMQSGFKMPWFPVLPIMTVFASFILLFSLNTAAIWLMVAWLVIGILVYLFYGIQHD